MLFRSISTILFFIGIAGYVLGYLIIGVVKILDKIFRVEKNEGESKVLLKQQDDIKRLAQESSTRMSFAENLDQKSAKPQDEKSVLGKIIEELDIIIFRLKSFAEEKAQAEEKHTDSELNK